MSRLSTDGGYEARFRPLLADRVKKNIVALASDGGYVVNAPSFALAKMSSLFFADDPQFEFEAIRALGHAAYGGADLGEVLSTVRRIVAGDYESWYHAWLGTAERIADVAKRAFDQRHSISARDSFLRASNYYRSAEFFLHGATPHPRATVAYARAVESFQAAAACFVPAVEPVQIPFEGKVLYGYFYRASARGVRPAIIMHNGFDGSAEEMHFMGAAAAQERGYHVLTFDGPGQPAARHREGMVFRPNWETVVTPVLDWLIASRPEVDADKVALLGVSMGGLLAPRAAAFETRLAACIAIDGVYDLGAISTGKLGGMPRDQAEKLLRAEHAPELDEILSTIAQSDPTARWAFSHGMHVMGVNSPRKFLAAYLDYSLHGIAARIRCPTLVCDAEEDLFFAGQPAQLFANLTCRKTLLRFTSAEGAGVHCHSGAQRLTYARVYDWLDTVLGTKV